MVNMGCLHESLKISSVWEIRLLPVSWLQLLHSNAVLIALRCPLTLGSCLNVLLYRCQWFSGLDSTWPVSLFQSSYSFCVTSGTKPLIDTRLPRAGFGYGRDLNQASAQKWWEFIIFLTENFGIEPSMSAKMCFQLSGIQGLSIIFPQHSHMWSFFKGMVQDGASGFRKKEENRRKWNKGFVSATLLDKFSEDNSLRLRGSWEIFSLS